MPRKTSYMQNGGSVRTPDVQIQTVARSFSGPLPPPEALARYNDVLPGAAERIVAMAEKQQEHRQMLEKNVVFANSSSQTRGTYLGFIVAMSAIIGGTFLIYAGRGAMGIAAIISSLAALVGVFVYGRRSQRSELAKKAAPLPR
jgi:uncharacterized membrane protein